MTTDNILDLIRAKVAAAQAEHRLPSLTVGLARAGRPLCLESAGFADVQQRRVASGSVQYRLGSVTKTFTAAVVLLLAERQVLDLDEPVDRYLPGTGIGRSRVRQLLAHTGGVPREAPLPMWSTMRGPDRDGLIEALARAGPLARPGERWHYSNLGYAILGQVVRRVTGSTCEDLITGELLAPLGLASTTWKPLLDRAVGYRQDPYLDGVLHQEPEMEQGEIGVAGQLWSTAEDLLGWGHALAGGVPEVLPPEVTTAMHTPQVMVDPDRWDQGWGLGLILDRRSERIVSGHTGAMPGFGAAISIDRAAGVVVLAFANVTRGIALNELCLQIIDETAGRLPGEPVEQRTPTLYQPAAGLAGVLGRWWSESEETVFSWRDGALRAHLAGRAVTTATTFGHEGADCYRALTGRLRGEWLLVKRDENGDVSQLEWATYPYHR
jgi:CubicO group peptidase (beta-lactamase class C family)